MNFFNLLFSTYQEIQCYICKSFGHLCCADFADPGPGELSCYRCGQLGHNGLVLLSTLLYFDFGGIGFFYNELYVKFTYAVRVNFNMNSLDVPL